MKSTILKVADKLNLYPLFYPFTKNTAAIFMLHGIAPGQNDFEALPAGTLRDFFSYLKNSNYRVMSLSNYVRAIIEKQDTYKTVVLRSMTAIAIFTFTLSRFLRNSVILPRYS
jgi:hypothetical protein